MKDYKVVACSSQIRLFFQQFEASEHSANSAFLCYYGYMSHKRARPKKFREPALYRTMFKGIGVAAILLVPWTIWLSYSLPSDHVDDGWNVAWSGFDIGLLISLALTAYFGLRRSGWVAVAATMAGSLLVVDAWFDSVTAMGGWQRAVSLSSAVAIELPLAFICFWIAYKAGRQFFGKP